MAIFGDLDPATAMRLLQMSGALGTPVRQGGGVGPGFAAFGQGYQAQQQLAERRQLMQAQIEQMQAHAEAYRRGKQQNRYIPFGNYLFDTETNTLMGGSQQ